MVHKPENGPSEIVPFKSLKPFEPLAQALAAKGGPFEWEEKFINGRLQKVWLSLPSSSRDIWLECIKNFSVRDHLVYEASRYTYQQSHQEVLKCAQWLRGEFQVRKGDHVAIISRNVPEFVWSYFAVSLLGAIPVIINAFSDTDTLVFSLLEADVRVAIMDHERWAKLKPVLNQFASPNPTRFESPTATGNFPDPRLAGKSDYNGVEGLVVFPRTRSGKVDAGDRDWSRSGQGIHDWEGLGEKWGFPMGDQIPEPRGGILPEDIALIVFTSGTTGRPKAVISTNRQQLSTMLTAGFVGLAALLRRGGSPPQPEQPGMNPNQGAGICMVPLFHLTGLSSMISTSVKGSKLVLMYKYSADEAARLIIKEKLKTAVGIGFMIKEVINSNKDVWKTLETISHGGSSSAKEIPGEVQKKGPGIMTSNGYGMTEVNVMAAANIMDEYNAFPNSVGRTAPVIDFKIVDLDSGKALGIGEVGEVWIKGPGNAIGYYKRAQATQDTFTSDGYVRSGDLGKIDENGLLYILDRAKDIIIRGGENITCSEVEQGVYNDQRVMHCAVVPLPHPTYGEQVAAVCVLHEEFRAEERRPTPQEIMTAAARTLPKHMVPSYVWIRDEDLPRNPSGKVLKKDLKEQVKARAMTSKAKL